VNKFSQGQFYPKRVIAVFAGKRPTCIYLKCSRPKFVTTATSLKGRSSLLFACESGFLVAIEQAQSPGHKKSNPGPEVR
jgi:hypothetical protein